MTIDDLKGSLQIFLLSGQSIFSVAKPGAQILVDALDAPMTEDEILLRAAEAYKGLASHPMFDTPRSQVLSAVAQALRDLDKPLVDPVVLACREICAAEERVVSNVDASEKYRSGEWDHHYAMRVAIAAYKAAAK